MKKKVNYMPYYGNVFASIMIWIYTLINWDIFESVIAVIVLAYYCSWIKKKCEDGTW